MKIKELYSGPEKWTKGVLARNAEGKQVDIKHPTAECFCIIGALKKCYASNIDDMQFQFAVAKIITELGPIDSLASWNDAPERTFEEVKALVERADV
jgi:hypothetical protein